MFHTIYQVSSHIYTVFPSYFLGARASIVIPACEHIELEIQLIDGLLSAYTTVVSLSSSIVGATMDDGWRMADWRKQPLQKKNW
jgi:hypothetical protein